MTSFVLKIIAIAAMLIDHIGSAIDNNTMRIIGRLAFPIFAFQLAVGYSKTKNIKKYLIRLFIFAIISFVPYLVFTRIGVIHNYSFIELLSLKNNYGSGAAFEKYTCFNVLFTMFFAIIVLLVYDLKPDNFIDKNDKLMFVLFWITKIILMSAIIAIVYYLRMDYCTYGILLILGIYISIKHELLTTLTVPSNGSIAYVGCIFE